MISLKNNKGEWAETAEECANLLGDFFQSTYVEPKIMESVLRDDDNYPKQTRLTEYIPDTNIQSSEVQKILSGLNVNKSLGPDRIHPKLLKSLAADPTFVDVITKLFQRCYDTGKIPSIWKSAQITALHKKGAKSDPCNYRPISLTCILSKVYEKLLRNIIMEYFHSHVRNQQHGFLAKKSCLSNLREAMECAYSYMDNENAADIIYLDFQKAFDTVPHDKLLQKMELYGIDGITINAVRDFLMDRTFYVKVGEHVSKKYNVWSGVPQGSVLGPLLFLIYINDLPDGIASFVSMFADDVKMIVSPSAAVQTNKDLELLNQWQKKWLLTFNTDDKKCKVLHAGSRNACPDYFLGDVKLPTVELEKDLGIYVSHDLSWKSHILRMVNKAKSVSGWVKRNVISREKQVMLTIYKSLIRPHLEYCVQVWNPPAKRGFWGLIVDIENVQRQFTRLIEGLGLLTYEKRLENIGLTTLVKRRMRGDLIETFKVRGGMTKYGSNFYRPSRSGMKLLNTVNKGKYIDNFISNRVVSYWNKIPDSVKQGKTVEAFKSRLENFKRDNREVKGNFWELSDELFSRIDVYDREAYENFMTENPDVARRKGINVSS